MTEIQKILFTLPVKKYAYNIVPEIDEKLIIGVYTPCLRKLAKEMIVQNQIKNFMAQLPHKYFEENQLHTLILSEIKDFNECIYEIENFLPYIDNWATCDQLSPKCFRKQPEKILPYIEKWLKSEHLYTVRFAIVRLMTHFLDNKFDIKYPTAISRLRSEEYYLKMAVAWYFATALAKQYDAIIPFIEQEKLDRWTHNKTIQKALESFRITAEQKEYLKTLKK